MYKKCTKKKQKQTIVYKMCLYLVPRFEILLYLYIV